MKKFKSIDEITPEDYRYYKLLNFLDYNGYNIKTNEGFSIGGTSMLGLLSVAFLVVAIATGFTATPLMAIPCGVCSLGFAAVTGVAVWDAKNDHKYMYKETKLTSYTKKEIKQGFKDLKELKKSDEWENYDSLMRQYNLKQIKLKNESQTHAIENLSPTASVAEEIATEEQDTTLVEKVLTKNQKLNIQAKHVSSKQMVKTDVLTDTGIIANDSTTVK